MILYYLFCLVAFSFISNVSPHCIRTTTTTTTISLMVYTTKTVQLVDEFSMEKTKQCKKYLKKDYVLPMLRHHGIAHQKTKAKSNIKRNVKLNSHLMKSS